MDDSKIREELDGVVEPSAQLDSPRRNDSNGSSNSRAARLIRLRLVISAGGAMSRVEMDNLAACVAAIKGYPLDFEYRRRELDIIADTENLSESDLGETPASRFEADLQILVNAIPRHMSVKLTASLIAETDSHRVKNRFTLGPNWKIKKQSTIDEEAKPQTGSNSAMTFWNKNNLAIAGIILLTLILVILHTLGFIRIR